MTKTTGIIDHAAGAGSGGGPGNASNDLGHAFEINSQVVPMRTVAYYIGTSGGRTGLWRIAGAAAAEELVEGVERMELRFGEDTSRRSHRGYATTPPPASATGPT